MSSAAARTFHFYAPRAPGAHVARAEMLLQHGATAEAPLSLRESLRFIELMAEHARAWTDHDTVARFEIGGDDGRMAHAQLTLAETIDRIEQLAHHCAIALDHARRGDPLG